MDFWLLDTTYSTEMFSKLFFMVLLGLTLAAEEPKNTKRSLNSLNLPPWSSAFGHPWASSSLSWHPNALGGLHPFSSGYGSKGPHYGLAADAADITAALAAAKEATAAAVLAKQKVQAAREQVAIQEKIAAAKEAAAHAAIQRSEAAAEIAAVIQRLEALAAAAAAQKPAATPQGAKYPTAWANPKSNYNHWN